MPSNVLPTTCLPIVANNEYFRWPPAHIIVYDRLMHDVDVANKARIPRRRGRRKVKEETEKMPLRN